MKLQLMKKELATIKGQIEGELITIGLDDDNRLCASNGDDVHPAPRVYRAGIEGERQAIRDIEAMWGRDWTLEWLPAAEIEMNGAAGYVDADEWDDEDEATTTTITLVCSKCDYITDTSIFSETIPDHCPKCGAPWKNDND